MTTERARKPARPHPADAGTSPGVDQQAGVAASDEVTGPATAAAAAAAAPDDVQQLRQEIARTRENLGNTVDQLAAKADVKARAQATAAELSGRMKNHMKKTASRAQQQAAARAAAVRTPLRQATPEPLQQAVAKGAATAQQRRMPLAVATGVLLAGYLVIRRWRKR